MTSGRTSISLYAITIWLAALALALVTYLQPGTHLEFIGGIDHSWAYGLNVAFDKRLVMGQDIIFTFGPLGFLEHTRVVSLQMLYISSAFSLGVSVVMNAALLHLAWISTSHRGLRAVNLVAAVTLVAFSFPHMQRLLVLGYSLLLLHWLTGRWLYLAIFSLTVTLSVLIKFSYGAASFALLLAYLALAFWKNRDVRLLWCGLGSLLLSYLLIWFLIYGSFGGTFDYLLAEFHISRGNASAMALNPENNWSAVALFYLCILLVIFTVHRQSGGVFAWLPLVFLLPLFVWTKYTFSQQEEFHQVPILAFITFVGGIFIVVMPTLLRKIQLALVLVIAWFAWIDMHTESVGPPDYQNVPHLTVNKPEIMQYEFRLKRLFNIWRVAEKERLQPLLLPEDMRNIIGDSRVDIYPWELTIASVNDLNWHPRPAFQIYISYLPFIDQKNADFFNSDDAPEFIIWHHHFYQDIMNRYSLSSEPLTVASILDHYRMESCKGYFCLWRRTDAPQLVPAASSEPRDIQWNEWVQLPDARGDVLRAKLFAKRTLLGKLNLMVWKEGGIEIDYEFMDGSIKTHDLLIDNAVSGVWISPYVESYLGSSGRVAEISSAESRKITARMAPLGNMEAVEPALAGYRIRGWMAESADQGETCILLTSASKNYLIPVGKINRPDVAAHFASLGRRVSAQSGIDQEIDVQALQAGTYQVRFVARSADGWSALRDQGFTITVDAATQNKHQVKQFRIRTTRPWAFEKSAGLQWERLQFSKGLPWQ